MANDLTAETAAQFAARCLANGDGRPDVAESLQTFFGVSRATAYRTIARAMLGTGEPPADIARTGTGAIDLAAEAERQYAAAVSNDDSKAALRWFNVLQRLAS
jgi:hypothetical protein